MEIKNILLFTSKFDVFNYFRETMFAPAFVGVYSSLEEIRRELNDRHEEVFEMDMESNEIFFGGSDDIPGDEFGIESTYYMAWVNPAIIVCGNSLWYLEKETGCYICNGRRSDLRTLAMTERILNCAHRTEYVLRNAEVRG